MSQEEKFFSDNEDKQKEKLRIKAAIIDASALAEDEARDVANAKMTASKEEISGFSGFLKRIWKHNLFHEYFRQKEIAKAREKISRTGNIYANETVQDLDSDKAKQVLVERFISEHEELVHKEAGEKKEELGENDQEMLIKEDIKKAINEYASGSLTDETFVEEKNRILSRVKGVRKDIIEKGDLFADNLHEVAKQVKQAIEHGQKIEELDFDLEVVIGKAKGGVRTEAQFSAVDKITEKILRGTKGFVNEATVASAVSIAYTLGAKVSQRLLGSRLFAYGSFGATALLGGGIAAARESKRLEEERRQHFREMAKGKKFDETKSPRRMEMEEFRYQSTDAVALINELESGIYVYDETGKRETRSLSQEEFESVLACLADVEARTRMSDRQKIDLINFSESKLIEEERMKLDLMRAKSKVDLRKMIEGGRLQIPGGKSFDEYLNDLSEARMQEFVGGDQGIEKKNELFKKMKHKKVWKAGLKGVIFGAGVGLAVQEVGAFVQENQEGLIENFVNSPAEGADGGAIGSDRYTLLEHARRWISGDLPWTNPENVHIVALGNNYFGLPEGVELVEGSDGTINLMRGEDVIGENLQFNPDGSLSDEARMALEESGVLSRSTLLHAGPQELVSANENLMHKVHRTLWYDNDTPRPVFDKNELRLLWGGQSGTGVDAEGHYVFNIKNMAADGSYHGKFSVDAQEAMQSGKLKMLFSLSQDTQNQVIEVPIDQQGNISIDPNSETGKLLFEINEKGHAVFKGRFAEVAESVGVKEGIDQVRILSTYEGAGIDARDLPYTVFDVPADYKVDAPWVIPVVGRSPLEPSENRKLTDETKAYYYGYGAEGFGLLARSEYKKRMSEKILKNKDFDLIKNDSELTDEYLAKQDPEYVKELENIIAESPKMKKSIEAVITIPAFMEGGNLEKTLRNYAKIKNKSNFEIVIFENHPESKERDNTAEVIKKMQAEFADLNIVHLYKAFKNKPEIGRVRKYLLDAVMLRKQKAKNNRSLALISNDADLEDISENYISNIINVFKENPRADALAAKWDYPENAFKQFPLMHVSQRLWHYLDIAFRNYYLKSPELIGRNSAFRSGAYAAVGGYNEQAELAEDLEIGWLIKDARGYDADRVAYLNSAWLVSNPRRAVVKLMSGGRLVQQYGDFHVNEEVRSAPLDKLLEERKEFKKEDFEKEVQAIYDHYFSWRKSKGGWVEDAYLEKSFARAMRFLGVKFEVNDDKIVIKDMSKLESNLKKYRTK